MTANDDQPVILFAEDDDAIRQVVVYLLADLGAKIHGVASGFAASAFLETQKADLIITDMAMPDGDGMWLIKWARGSDRHRHTRIVVLSAHAAPATMMAAKQAGADDYLLKPFEPLKFREAIARHLQAALARQADPARADGV